MRTHISSQTLLGGATLLMEETLNELSKKASDLLKRLGIKIATAESCTGGLIGHTLTNIPGSSEYYDRGIISYSNQAKTELLGVPQETIDKFGAVSPENAKAMAQGLKKNAGVDISIATTGIAGPTGGTPEKPVGLVYISLALQDGRVIVSDFTFSGDRLENKQSTCAAALRMLLENVTESHP